MTADLSGITNIRTGTANDLAAVLRVAGEAEYARNGVPTRRGHGLLGRVEKLLRKDPAHVSIATDPRPEHAEHAAPERVIGCAVAVQGLANDGVDAPVAGLCHIAAVCVQPEHWGRGIGERIVRSLLTELPRIGFDRAQLWTHADNARAHQLYERLGFTRTGRVKRSADGEDIVHYICAPLR